MASGQGLCFGASSSFFSFTTLNLRVLIIGCFLHTISFIYTPRLFFLFCNKISWFVKRNKKNINIIVFLVEFRFASFYPRVFALFINPSLMSIL